MCAVRSAQADQYLNHIYYRYLVYLVYHTYVPVLRCSLRSERPFISIIICSLLVGGMHLGMSGLLLLLR